MENTTVVASAHNKDINVTKHLEEAVELSRKWEDQGEGLNNDELSRLQDLIIESLAEVAMAVHLRQN